MKTLLFSVMCLLLAGALLCDHATSQSSITFYDVGQGDATHIRAASGVDVLIDGGVDDVVLQRLGETMPIYDRTIEVLVVTHLDADHIGGVISVLERYHVKTFVWSGDEPDSPLSEKLLEAAQKNAEEVVVFDGDEVLQFDDVVMRTYFVPQAKEKNDRSLVFVVDAPAGRFLLTGDAEEKSEQALLGQHAFLRADVYKAGHHGSKTSSSQKFLDALQAREVVISAGCDNRYGHPHDEVVERFKKVNLKIRQTCGDGSIEYAW